MRDPPDRKQWTFAGGFTRALLAGSGLALLFALILGFVAAYLPTLVFHYILRFVIAFGVCWVLMKTIQRVGGAVGLPFTALGVVLALLVMLSHHLAVALGATPAVGKAPTGFGLDTLLFLNIGAIAGILVAAWVTYDE